MIANQIAGALGAGAGGGGGSFESIATQYATGSSVTFSSIPSTYKHLQLRWYAAATSGAAPTVRFNGDSSSVYATHGLDGSGNAVYAQGQSSATSIQINYWGIASVANNFTGGITDIHDYASTTKNKTVRTFSGNDENGGGVASLASGLWASTAAINSITISLNSPTSGTFYALYGIKG